MLKNLTPHTVNIVTDEETITLPPSGTVARVEMTRQQIGEVHHRRTWPLMRTSYSGEAKVGSVRTAPIPLYRNTLGEVTGLPAHTWLVEDPYYGETEVRREKDLGFFPQSAGVHNDAIPGAPTSAWIESEGGAHRAEPVFFIVSRVVAEAMRDRGDLLIPDDAIRDEKGRIVGCRALARV